MEWFFLYRYKETKNPFYLRMFKSLMAKKRDGEKVGITLRPRPFLQPTIKDLESGDFRERIQSTLFLELAKVWNG
jgi:hypothetical protein